MIDNAGEVGQPRPVTEDVGACPPARPLLGRRAGSADPREAGRLARALVWLGLAVGAGVVGIAYAALLATHPLLGALVMSHLLALGVGLYLRDARRAAVTAVSEWLGEEMEARKIADAAGDKHFVGPISGEVPICGETKGPGGPAATTVMGDDLDPEPWLSSGAWS